MKIFNRESNNNMTQSSSDDTSPWLIVGLGNPGSKYEMTWHNAGFMCLDLLSRQHHIPITKIKFKGLYGQGIIEGQKVILLKPATFMNNSGESVNEAMTFFKIPASHTLLIYDDIDIDCGSIRIRPSGTGGTHNGMRSVVAHMNTTAFPRIRIGIGPIPENRDIVSYVLSEIPQNTKTLIYDSLNNATLAINEILGKSLAEGMSRYNPQRKKQKDVEGDNEDA